MFNNDSHTSVSWYASLRSSALARLVSSFACGVLTFSLYGAPATASALESYDDSAQTETVLAQEVTSDGDAIPSVPNTTGGEQAEENLDTESADASDTPEGQETNQPVDDTSESDLPTEDAPSENDMDTAPSSETTSNEAEDEAAGAPSSDEAAPPQAAAANATASGTFILRSSLSGTLVVDKSGGIKADKSSGDARLWNSNGSAAQQVSISYDSSGLATIGLSDGTVLDVAGGKAVKGADVRWWKSNGTAAQKWLLVKNSDGSITAFSALDQAFCLDVQGGEAANGANLHLWTSNSSKAQHFVAIPFAGVAPASNVSLNGKIVEISSALGGSLVMDVASGSTSAGAKAQLWKRNGSLAQAWRLETQGNGYYLLRPTHSRAVLGVTSGGVLPSIKAIQQSLSSSGATSTQLWSIRQLEDGSYNILAANSSLALDVTGGTAANGTALQLYRPNGSSAQKWNITVLNDAPAASAAALEPGTYRLESAQTTATLGTPALVADVASGSTENGANVRLWSSNSSVAQQFRVKVGSDGKTITFVGTSSLKALDVASASPWPLANIQIYRSNNSAAQHWYAYANSDGTYSLRSVSSGLALDAAGASKGANLRTNLPSASSKAQRFRLVKVVDMRSFDDMLSKGQVKSIRIIGDSISDGYGLPGYSTATRGTAIAYKNGSTVRYESPLTLATYANSMRKYTKNRGVNSFVTAGISGWKMSQFAANPDAWLLGGADVVIVALGVNDARAGANVNTFKDNAETALAAAADTCKLLIVVTEPCGLSTPTSMSQIDAVLRQVCTDNGYMHVSVVNALYATTTYYNSDLIHPTEAGQSLLWWSLSQQLCLS